MDASSNVVSSSDAASAHPCHVDAQSTSSKCQRFSGWGECDNMKANSASGTKAYLRRAAATDNRTPRWRCVGWPRLRIANTKACCTAFSMMQRTVASPKLCDLSGSLSNSTDVARSWQSTTTHNKHDNSQQLLLRTQTSTLVARKTCAHVLQPAARGHARGL